jgi:chromosome segregation ATPase
MSIPQRSKLLHSLRQWKTKAIARREQIEALKKRLGELTDSRDTWKRKAHACHGRETSLQIEMKGLRAEVATLRGDVGAFQAKLSDLQQQVAHLQAENQRLRPPSDASEKKLSRPVSA